LFQNPYSEALLAIGDSFPHATPLAASAPLATPLLGNGGAGGLYSGNPGSPNIFQAQQIGLNAVNWAGIPIDPQPGPSGVNIHLLNVRISNVVHRRAKLPPASSSSLGS